MSCCLLFSWKSESRKCPFSSLSLCPSFSPLFSFSLSLAFSLWLPLSPLSLRSLALSQCTCSNNNTTTNYSKFAALALFCAAFLVLQVWFAPFFSSKDNQLEFFSLSFLLILSQVLPVLKEPYSLGGELIVSVLILVPVFILAFVIGKGWYVELRKFKEELVKNRKRNAGIALGAATGAGVGASALGQFL